MSMGNAPDADDAQMAVAGDMQGRQICAASARAQHERCGPAKILDTNVKRLRAASNVLHTTPQQRGVGGTSVRPWAHRRQVTSLTWPQGAAALLRRLEVGEPRADQSQHVVPSPEGEPRAGICNTRLPLHRSHVLSQERPSSTTTPSRSPSPTTPQSPRGQRSSTSAIASSLALLDKNWPLATCTVDTHTHIMRMFVHICANL